MRFVLMHDTDPSSLIHAAKGLLKPGGVIASQESTMSTSHSSSDNPVFREYVDTSIALGKKLGGDYDIGNRLSSLYEQAGFDKIDASDNQPKVGIDAVKAILPSILEEGQRAVTAGIISQEKVEEWSNVIAHWPEDDTNFAYFPAKQTYLLAWKGKK